MSLSAPKVPWVHNALQLCIGSGYFKASWKYFPILNSQDTEEKKEGVIITPWPLYYFWSWEYVCTEIAEILQKRFPGLSCSICYRQEARNTKAEPAVCLKHNIIQEPTPGRCASRQLFRGCIQVCQEAWHCIPNLPLYVNSELYGKRRVFFIQSSSHASLTFLLFSNTGIITTWTLKTAKSVAGCIIYKA